MHKGTKRFSKATKRFRRDEEERPFFQRPPKVSADDSMSYNRTRMFKPETSKLNATLKRQKENRRLKRLFHDTPFFVEFFGLAGLVKDTPEVRKLHRKMMKEANPMSVGGAGSVAGSLGNIVRVLRERFHRAVEDIGAENALALYYEWAEQCGKDRMRNEENKQARYDHRNAQLGLFMRGGNGKLVRSRGTKKQT